MSISFLNKTYHFLFRFILVMYDVFHLYVVVEKEEINKKNRRSLSEILRGNIDWLT